MNTKLKKEKKGKRKAGWLEKSVLLVPDVAGSGSGHHSSPGDTAVGVRYISQDATVTGHD